MTTLLETIKDAKETIEHLFKGDVAAWSLGGSARARATLEKLEQAIAQEQKVKPFIACTCFGDLPERYCTKKDRCSKVVAYSIRANELIEIFKDAPDVPPLLMKTDNWEPKP